MIEFNRKTWIEAFWFLDAGPLAHRLIGNPSGVGMLCDVIACLYRPIAGGPWTFVYRMRYGTRESDPAEDARNWYQMKLPASESLEQSMEKLRTFVRQVADVMGATPDETIIQGDGDVAARKLLKKPWFNPTGLVVMPPEKN